MDEKLTEQTQQIITMVQNQEVFNEAEVRIRHARIARIILDKLVVRMEAVSPDELSPEQASRMVMQYMELERKALGLVDKKFEVTSLHKERDAIITVEDRKVEHENREALAAKLLEYLNSKTSLITDNN